MRMAALLASLPLLGQFDAFRELPLAARQEPLAERGWARIRGGSYAGVHGERISFVLVAPKTRGRHPAVLFQHGSGQSMAHYISEALILADTGVTSLLDDVPGANPRQTLVDLVHNERRALELLIGQVGVDATRIGYVGHSYGGLAGGILSGIDARPRALVLLGAVPSLARHIRESPSEYSVPLRLEAALQQIAGVDAGRYLPQTRRSVFVQCARFDTLDNVKGCPEVHRLAGGPKRLTWYDEDHNFTSHEAMRDRLRWLAAELGIGGIEPALLRSVRRK